MVVLTSTTGIIYKIKARKTRQKTPSHEHSVGSTISKIEIHTFLVVFTLKVINNKEKDYLTFKIASDAAALPLKIGTNLCRSFLFYGTSMS